MKLEDFAVKPGMCWAIGLLLLVGCESNEPAPPPLGPLGGDTTISNTTDNAFSLPAPNLNPSHQNAFFVGNSFFKQNWVQAPASTVARDGLGPLFNARSCSACHSKDGRAAPPMEGETFVGLLLRVSLPGPPRKEDGVAPHPVYGVQIQNRAIAGHLPEVVPQVRYEEVPGRYPDGTTYSLRRPVYTLKNPAYGSLPSNLHLSPRIAPHIIGMGLLEAIPEARLMALADPDDADGDGISGRVNWVWHPEAGEWRVGRFGWKANAPDIRTQTAAAFLHDMGITSPVFPRENITPGHGSLAKLPHGGSPEIEEKIFRQVVLYTQALAVPAQRNARHPDVLAGHRIFRQLNCQSCHVETHITGPVKGFPEFSHQTIHPFTDLLLHDMGPDLADGRPDFEASGREWRTPPLWGLGLIPVVNGHSFLLHDGRARSFEEAILWHGGEAEASREAFKALSLKERLQLLRFLESL
jgi:CxxC motif-containing protein (DUF1111 family)